MEEGVIKYLQYLSESQYRKSVSSVKKSGPIVIEKPLSDSKKADLVVGILNMLVKEQLSLNQIQEILCLASNEAFKISITGF